METWPNPIELSAWDPSSIERVTVDFSGWRVTSYQRVWCACWRSFGGRDGKRVMQHYRRHAKRCTVARRYKRNLNNNTVPLDLLISPKD